MFNVYEVADSIVNHIKSKFPNDISLIGHYGSYAQGTATQRSDFDFFFIPAAANSDGYRHSIQFVVNNISFDFGPSVGSEPKKSLQQKEAYSNGPSYPDRMRGFYEEVKGILDKVLTACETNDYVSAYFWGIGVQGEISRFLYYAEKGCWPVSLDPSLDYQNVYKNLGFPDLTEILDGQDLSPLFEAVHRLDSLLEIHLKNQGVEINRFRNNEEFNEFLKTFNIG